MYTRSEEGRHIITIHLWWITHRPDLTYKPPSQWLVISITLRLVNISLDVGIWVVPSMLMSLRVTYIPVVHPFFLFFCCCCCCWHSYSSSCIQMIAGCIHMSDLDVAQNNNELPWCCHFWLLTQIQCISQIISKPNKTNGSGLTLPDPNSIHVLCPFWGRSPWRWCHCWGAFFLGQLLWHLLIWG